MMKKDLFIAGGLLALGLALLLPYWNFVGDDAFIHLRFIESLHQRGEFAFNPGEATYGSTSPLWVILIAALRPLFDDPIFALKLVSLILALSSLLFFFLLSREYFKDTAWVVASVALLAFDPWFIKWTMSGMENGLTLALLLSGFWWHLRQRNSGKPNWLSPLLFGLCWLTRPEIFLFLGLILLDILLFETGKKKQNLSLLFTIVAAIQLPWLIYAYSAFSTVIPNTILARQAEEAYSLPFEFTLTKTIKVLLSNNLLELLVLGVLGGAALNKKWRAQIHVGKFADLFVLALWPLGLIAFYLAGKTNVMGRYLLMATPFIILLGLRALRALLQGFALRPRLQTAGLGLFALAVIAQLLVVQIKYTFFVTHFSKGMDDELIAMGTWFAENTPPETLIAAHEFGALGYYSQRRILDLSGLVSPEVIPYIKQKRLLDIVKEKKPAFVVEQSWEEFDLLQHPEWGEYLTPLFVKRVQREGSSVAGKKEIMSVYKTKF